MVLLLIIFTIIIAYVIHYYLRVRKYPKGPFPLPLIGNTYHMPATDHHKYLDLLSKTYGPCYTLFLPKPTVILTDHRFIKEALVTQGDLFIGRSHLPPESLFQKEKQTGILISDGEVWREQRRTSIKILRDFGMGKNIMEEKVGKRLLFEQSISEVVLLIISLCIGDVINELLFGFHYSHGNCAEFEHFFQVITDHFTMVKRFTFSSNVPVDVSPIYSTVLFPKKHTCRIIGRK